MVQIKRSIRPDYVSVSAFIFLCSILPNLHISTTRSTALQTHVIASKHSILSSVPSTTSTTSITANDFATFFTDRTRTISGQFSAPHTQDLEPTTSTDKTPIFSFCPLIEAEVSKLSKLSKVSKQRSCGLFCGILQVLTEYHMVDGENDQASTAKSQTTHQA